MKKNNNLIQMLRSGQLRLLKDLFNRITSVKAGKGWINWFNRIVDLILVGKRPSWTRAVVVFVRFAFVLQAKSGTPGLVLYLKACNVLLMQAVGGMRLNGTRGLKVAVSRSADGLPRVIPSVMRGMIRSGDRKALRIWLSLFSLYRVIEYKGFLKLSTITSPGPSVGNYQKWEGLIKQFFRPLGITDAKGFRGGLESPVKSMIYKSSPAVAGLPREELEWKHSTSWVGIQQAAVSLYNSDVWAPFVEFHSLVSSPREGVDRYWNYVKRIEGLALSAASTFKPGPLGRLGLKQEAAGKVRVFAMVDCWTQWLLRPLHLGLFHLLDRLPADGTHDQLRPVRRLLDSGETRFWSFDLSAATDRLPVDLQAYLLDFLLGETKSSRLGGQVWKELLVSRSYVLPESAKQFAKGELPKEVMYAVGQPMGALSSWAMLALCHHFLVGVSALRAGYPMGNFSSYALLGDDIVIADGRVARCYLQLMRELGVEIGLAKSLVSRSGVLEFAKRYFVQGEDCSPVPLTEVAVAYFSGFAALEFARKYAVQFSRLCSVLGYGYRVKARLAVLQSLPKRLRGMAVAWYSPWGVESVALDKWVQMKSALKPMILNTPLAVLSFEACIRAMLETAEVRIKKFVKDSSGYTIEDVPRPKWEPTGKPGSDDDRQWLTYFTIRDQIKQAFNGLQIDLRHTQMLVAGLRRALKEFDQGVGQPLTEDDLMESRNIRRFTMLLRNVRQLLQPRPKEAVIRFDEVLKVRKSLSRGMQRTVLEGDGFIIYDVPIFDKVGHGLKAQKGEE